MTDSAGTTTIAEYRYDGEGRRIARLVPNGENWDRTDYYYDEAWQCLEERYGEAQPKETVPDTPAVQWLWDIRYIDAPVLRWRSVQGTLDEVLYVCNDANMNVTALVNTSGTAVERYVYDPYGEATCLDLDWLNGQSTSRVGNEILYCGYRFDPETGLDHVRHRYYHPTLGRWTAREPIDMIQQFKGLPEPEVVTRARDTAMANSTNRLGPEFAIRNLSLLEYADGALLYIYGGVNPTSRRDATGLVGWDAVPLIGWGIDPVGANVEDYAHLAVTLDECCNLGDAAATKACTDRITLKMAACHLEVGVEGVAKAVLGIAAAKAAVPAIETPLGWGLAAAAGVLFVDAGIDFYRYGKISDAAEKAKAKYCDCKAVRRAAKAPKVPKATNP